MVQTAAGGSMLSVILLEFFLSSGVTECMKLFLDFMCLFAGL